MSLAFYKIIHLICIILIPAFFGISFFSEPPRKWASIGGMILSLILVISGFGAMAKIGYVSFATWPLWIKIKLLIWVSIAGLGPVLKRFKGLGFAILMALFSVAVITVVLRPH
ncbi:hypothetical protein MNBD_BACTEROID05-755 [hydrothermal vent metagenome]|uniref:Uncharacterized protein n=1 Tax=hydrothermal vent metagenome TaxID=652676 RepID=A0A3B0TGA7_9ZZZZ